MKHYTFKVHDYEHEGDLLLAENYLLKKFPLIKNVKSYEDRDYEAETDYEIDYGRCDEPIYQGYVSFDAPDEYIEELRNFSL